MPAEKEGGVAPEKMRVRVYPDEVLRRVAGPAGESSFGEDLEELARRMICTMYAEEGVGLAAPQVGEPLRLIVIDASRERDSAKVLVNPVIVDASGREVMEEGCLSVPGVKGKVRRRGRVTVEFQTLAGERTGLDADGLLAHVIQHEIDHLDGTLFVDRLGTAGRLVVRRALRELEEASRE
jgi:peptide deformylase